MAAWVDGWMSSWAGGNMGGWMEGGQHSVKWMDIDTWVVGG